MKCAHCKNALVSKHARRFCDRSCSASYNNAKFPKRPSILKETICLGCREVYTYNSKNRRGDYCTNACQRKYAWDLRLRRIKKTNTFTNGGEAKRYLKETQGCRCKICKRKSWEGQPIPLVLDHIDGNSDNWHVTNLRLICPNCDAQTEFYKNKNKGNGRHSRMQRYYAGKSY